jgi:hypothetical protein
MGILIRILKSWGILIRILKFWGILICILKFWGILICILKFWAPLSAKRSGILPEVAEGRVMGMFLFTAALLMAL